ncbi:Polysaccharide deacetylase [Sinosporangium album]|uniref:Polysaccharide deacetylase n=1 Tax=Sinosporangium album TaxID=504805 RepID=A0A1G8GH71_9ACTN|nr:polysaccharide deacetylase family protein [Sinosporangium album]SDH93690.1 Polysaccharide deacetylase [Sinosporangium album]
MVYLRIGRIGILSLSVVALSGCLPWLGKEQPKAVSPQVQASAAQAKAAAARVASLAAAAKARANELGQIPVLMYHRIVEKPATVDDLTPKQFRTEMVRLAAEGYVPITAAEYATGRINIPAGKHPVVLTFDDSSPSQLTLDGMGVPKADTAVGILLDVGRRHPGFRPVGTFYVTRDMFGVSTPEEQAQMITWLRNNGFDVGNHTRDHHNLRGRDKKDVLAQVAAGHKLITDLVKEATPVTLALPYGNQPDKADWARKGSSGSVNYDYGGVFLAGYNPAPSPYSKDYNAVGIPRIRSGAKAGDCVRFCSGAWLDWLKANPDKRYTSDGDVKTVAYPKFKAPFMAKRYDKQALAY